MNDIAVLIDSGTDVPQEYIERFGMFVLPLVINYAALSYRDRVDITPEQVIDRLELEIPKTSLPSITDAVVMLKRIAKKGYHHVVVVTISSGLSGTHNLLRVAAEQVPALDVRLIDTKNIGIGAGITAIRAGELVEQGLAIDEVESALKVNIKKTKIFFCVSTLKYLQKGGRIGLVTAAVGALLGIQPVISCNDDGIYYTAKKVRGNKQAIETAVAMTEELAKNQKRFDLLVAHAGAEEKARQIMQELSTRIKGYTRLIFAPVSPALAVHTGPGLIGVGLQVY